MVESGEAPEWIRTLILAVSIGCLLGLLLPQPIHWRYMDRLRKEFPDLWEHLGKPSVSNDNGDFASLVFLWTRAYEEWPDPAARAFCASYRLPFIIGFSVVAASLTIFFVGLLSLGIWLFSQ